MTYHGNIRAQFLLIHPVTLTGMLTCPAQVTPNFQIGRDS